MKPREDRRVLFMISCERQFALPGFAAIVAPDPLCLYLCLYLYLYLYLDFGPTPRDGQTADHADGDDCGPATLRVNPLRQERLEPRVLKRAKKQFAYMN